MAIEIQSDIDTGRSSTHVLVADRASVGRTRERLRMDIRTWIYTMVNGDLVGLDEFGNRYYRGKGKRLHGRERRWCLYKGTAEASKVPPEWHAWLHHTVDAPLTESAANAQAWQKPHLPNLTGTTAAYRPAGHDYRGGKRAAATGDYEPWVPK